MPDPILVAMHGDIRCELLPALANRHGLITGATGTGKTITLQTLAEAFSRLGVPVFMADVKGDLTGISQPGTLAPEDRRGAEGTRTAGAGEHRLPDDAVGRLRRAGPPGARHRLRHGPAAARAHARAQRDPGRRAEPGLQDRRRQRPGAARHEGPARDAAVPGRQRGAVHHRVRQHQRGQHRRDPARADADRGTGRRQVLRRADAGRSPTSCRPSTGRVSSTSSPPTS